MKLFPVLFDLTPTTNGVSEAHAAPEDPPEDPVTGLPTNSDPDVPVPAPQAFRTLYSLSEVDRVRHLNCRRYDGCLDMAVTERWEGFTCVMCKAFVPLTALQERKSVAGLLALYDKGRAADEE